MPAGAAIEVHRNGAIAPLHLIDDLNERVVRALRFKGQLAGAVGAGDQDPLALQPSTQVKEQADRDRISPVQIVDDEQQRLLLREQMEQCCVVLK